MAVWSQRWLALSEMAELILAVDTESAAEEDRKRLTKFEHADKVLRFLDEKRIGTLSDLQKAIGEMVTLQACWNHVSRLVKLGFLMRVDEGVYRLAPRGQAVAQLLATEKPKRQGARRRPVRVPRADTAASRENYVEATARNRGVSETHLHRRVAAAKGNS